MRTRISTTQKALKVNLDPSIYGTLAEIGAGQEVARYFFQAGAASQTVAKTMSAYDMAFSDAIYGKASRYVCESRVIKMIDHEYGLIMERLAGKREGESKFFSLANTVSAKQYMKDTECHGWMGIRFQLEDGGSPNEAIIHVRMLDDDILAQQQAIGVVGVNLIHACYFHNDSMEDFATSLLDNLSSKRIEVDMIRVKGKNLSHFDNRILSLQLVKHGMTEAVLFDCDGSVLQAADIFYKKPIMLARGSYRPPTLVNMEMLRNGLSQFSKKEGIPKEDIVSIAQITLANLKDSTNIDESDFLDRVDMLTSLGQRVLISSHDEYHKMTNYFSRYTSLPLWIVLGVYNIEALFSGEVSEEISIMEAFGKIFSKNTKLLVYPAKEDKKGTIINTNNLKIDVNLSSLYRHFRENEYIIEFDKFNPDILDIWSRKILKEIQSGLTNWEKEVPQTVVQAVKSKKLFGYKG